MKEEEKRNHKDEELGLDIVYEEAVDARAQQQKDLEMMNNKFNWIIVSDIVIISYLFQHTNNVLNIISLFLIILSLIISLLSIKMRVFRRGPLLTEMLTVGRKTKNSVLEALNKKIVEAIEDNKKIIKKFSNKLRNAIYLLIFGILFALLSVFFCPKFYLIIY